MKKQNKVAQICRTERRALRGHAGFILQSPFFGRKEKVNDLLMAFGLYRGFRRIYKQFMRHNNERK